MLFVGLKMGPASTTKNFQKGVIGSEVEESLIGRLIVKNRCW
jgi:hypothetical protein